MIIQAQTEPRGRWRVRLDGQDVTPECYYADDQSGVVLVYLRNERGKFYRRHGVIQQELRHGVVRIERIGP